MHPLAHVTNFAETHMARLLADVECRWVRSWHLAIAGGRGPRFGIPLALALQTLEKEHDKRNS
jgi:hypothetical protein